MAVTAGMSQGPPAGTALLRDADPRRALLGIPCSAAKAHGGQPPTATAGAQADAWPGALLAARAQVLAGTDSDASRLLPAWQRYQGGFYRHARPALGEAAAAGNVI